MSEELKPQDAPVVDAAPAPTPAPAPAPVKTTVQATAKPAPVVTETKAPAPAPTSFEEAVAGIKAKGSIAEKALVQSIETYMGLMKPGVPVADFDGAQHQYTLWRTIQSLIHQTPSHEFNKQWNILLAFFANNQDEDQVFHDRFVYRFSEFWNRNESELNAFQRILHLIKVTCNPATRKQNLRLVSLERTLAVGLTEEGRQKVLSFYA